jgi:hypothetical protein
MQAIFCARNARIKAGFGLFGLSYCHILSNVKTAILQAPSGTGGGRLSTLLLLSFLVFAVCGFPVKGQETHHERFVGYANIGPVFLTGEDDRTYETGFHVGTGGGLVYADYRDLTFEAIARVDWHRLPLKRDRTTPRGTRTAETETSVSLENRFRVESPHWLRPYLSIGLGLYDDGGAFIFALGTDIAASRQLLRPIYIEFRYMEADIAMLRLDIGLRLG